MCLHLITPCFSLQCLSIPPRSLLQTHSPRARQRTLKSTTSLKNASFVSRARKGKKGSNLYQHLGFKLLEKLLNHNLLPMPACWPKSKTRGSTLMRQLRSESHRGPTSTRRQICHSGRLFTSWPKNIGRPLTRSVCSLLAHQSCRPSRHRNRKGS